ncbi:MAG: P-II family nitrogen regulator [Brevinematales bacterium]|jgi:nitrogen regulatory protein P-II 1
MKRIEAIIRPEKAGSVINALDAIGHPGIMISEIEGHGKQHGIEESVRGKKYTIDLITKTRIEVIVKDSDVKKITGAIREAAVTGEIGDGKIFVHPVDDAIRVRTNEKGDEAV